MGILIICLCLAPIFVLLMINPNTFDETPRCNCNPLCKDPDSVHHHWR